jgi:hypothetical protein
MKRQKIRCDGMIGQLRNKSVLGSTKVFNKLKNEASKIRGVKETYSLIRELASISGSNVSNVILDRVMYSTEMLPPLGKEYWWFLFFGRDGERPMQLMLLIFRKYGRNMLFNDKKIILQKLTKNKFRAATAGWVYTGKEFHDLGDTNAITTIHSKRKMIISDISGQKIVFNGNFPDYKLKVGNVIDLNIKKGDYLKDKDGRGVFIPPFGMAWVDVFSDAEGIVLGEEFKGTAHLQKVVGITTFGPFHWGRIIFQNGSLLSFFCLKTGKDSKRYFHRSLTFHDHRKKNTIEFKKPKLKISKKEGKMPMWIVEGQDDDKKLRIVLESYAARKFAMNGGGSQVYIEYAVTPREFSLETANQMITLSDLGRGVGTFEDAYGSPI